MIKKVPTLSIAVWCALALISGMKISDAGRDPQFLVLVCLWPACYALHKLTCWMARRYFGDASGSLEY